MVGVLRACEHPALGTCLLIQSPNAQEASSPVIPALWWKETSSKDPKKWSC